MESGEDPGWSRAVGFNDNFVRFEEQWDQLVDLMFRGMPRLPEWSLRVRFVVDGDVQNLPSPHLEPGGIHWDLELSGGLHRSS